MFDECLIGDTISEVAKDSYCFVFESCLSLSEVVECFDYNFEGDALLPLGVFLKESRAIEFFL